MPFPIVAASVYIPSSSARGRPFLHSRPNTCCFKISVGSEPSGGRHNALHHTWSPWQPQGVGTLRRKAGSSAGRKRRQEAPRCWSLCPRGRVGDWRAAPSSGTRALDVGTRGCAEAAALPHAGSVRPRGPLGMGWHQGLGGAGSL